MPGIASARKTALLGAAWNCIKKVTEHDILSSYVAVPRIFGGNPSISVRPSSLFALMKESARVKYA